MFDDVIMIAAILSVVVGIVLLLIGWYWIESPADRACRRCKFDLAGSLRETTCPECGVALTPRNIVRFSYIRHRGLIMLGAIIALSAVAVAASVKLASANINAYKPVWLLRMQAIDHGSSSSSPALGELLTRQATYELTPKQINELVQAILRRQADPTSLWLPEWGSIVETAWEDGMLAQDEMNTYAKQGVSITAWSRGTVHQDRPAPLRVLVTGTRIGTGGLKAEVLTAKGQQRLSLPPKFGYAYVNQGMSHSVITEGPTPDQQGKTRLRIPVRLILETRRAPQKFTLKQTIELPVEVVPPDTPVITLLHDAAIDESVRSILPPPAVQARHLPSGKAKELSFKFNARALPVPCSFRMLIRWISKDGVQHEHSGGTLIFGQNLSWDNTSTLVVPQFDADHINLTLTPDPAQIENDPDFTEIWGEPIQFENLPVALPSIDPFEPDPK
jgi:hypothetical protein